MESSGGKQVSLLMDHFHLQKTRKRAGMACERKGQYGRHQHACCCSEGIRNDRTIDSDTVIALQQHCLV